MSTWCQSFDGSATGNRSQGGGLIVASKSTSRRGSLVIGVIGLMVAGLLTRPAIMLVIQPGESSMTAVMGKLAEGQFEIEVPFEKRSDEVGADGQGC